MHFHCHLNISTIQGQSSFVNPKSVGLGLEVIKLEYNLKLKIKRNDWLLADTCRQATNNCALFEFENEHTFYNLEARPRD